MAIETLSASSELLPLYEWYQASSICEQIMSTDDIIVSDVMKLILKNTLLSVSLCEYRTAI